MWGTSVASCLSCKTQKIPLSPPADGRIEVPFVDVHRQKITVAAIHPDPVLDKKSQYCYDTEIRMMQDENLQ